MKNTDKAKQLGKQLAESYYRDFTDTTKDYKGVYWKWENFPNFVYRHARVGCFMDFRYGVKNLDELKRVCAESARDAAIELMKDGKWKLAPPPLI
jgi:hypothetical protein